MTDEAAGPPAATAPPTDEAPHEQSRGTMTLMLLFLVALILMWGYIFILMVQGA